MGTIKTEVMGNTPAQVEEYLRAALLLVEALEPPEDLRVALFNHAVNLTSAKQLLFEQTQPLDGRLTLPTTLR